MSKRVRWRVLLILVVLIGAVAGFLFTGYRNAMTPDEASSQTATIVPDRFGP